MKLNPDKCVVRFCRECGKPMDLTINVARIVETIDKLEKFHISFEEGKRLWKEDVNNNIKPILTPEEASSSLAKKLCNNVLTHITKIENNLKMKMIPPSSIFEDG